MPYFNDVTKKLAAMLNWADLRHEQGVAVAGRIARLRRQIEAMNRRLRRDRPSAAVRRDEPNDLAAIRALRPGGPRRLWRDFDGRLYAEKVKGAWLARAAGCTLGAVVEGNELAHMEQLARHAGMKYPPRDYWTWTPCPWHKRYGMSANADYLRDGLRHVPVDDDLTYTVLGLLILEDYGPRFTTEHVGQAWLKYLPFACTAEDVTLRNLKAGVGWRRAGQKDNPFMDWIGADIRSDPWGYAAPGWPEKAAELAWRDARLSHRHTGILGEMYFSAVIAAAFAVEEPLEACRIGLSEIPRRCRLAEAVRWALGRARSVRDYRHARKLVDERFPGMSSVHTINNACLTIFGLALGGRDVTKVIGNTVAMGLDNDCTAATAGSIVGAVVGAAGVPERWYRPFRNRCRTYLIGRQWFTNTDIVRRFTNVARAVWAEGR